MKICLNTVTVGSQYPLSDIINEMERWGYGGIELQRERLPEPSNRNALIEVRRRLNDAGIAPAGIMAWAMPVTRDAREQIESIRVYGEVARLMGAPTLLVFAGEGGPTDPAALADWYRKAGARAREYAEAAGEGVTIALEPIGGVPGFGRPGDALAIAAASDHPRVGIMMDLFHYYKSSVTSLEVETIPISKLLIVHLNDCYDLPLSELNDSHRVYPGEGVIPVRSRLSILRRLGYKGHLSIELFNRGYWLDPLDTVVERCFRSTARLLAEA